MYLYFRLTDHIWVDIKQDDKNKDDADLTAGNKNITPQQIQTIAKLIEQPDILGDNETRFFKTFGHGIFDIFAAKLIYEKALENSMGEEVKL